MKKRLVSLLMALALCLGLLPVTALAAAPNGQVIYVGNVNVTSGGYWTTGNDGTVTAFTGEGTPADNFIHYDATNNVLTLHNAVIKKGLDYSESIQGGTYIPGSAIGVFHQNGAAELTIQLEGTNTIAEVSTGIYVLASSNSTGDASLTIMGSGSLDTSGSQSGIQVQSNSDEATLEINSAEVNAVGGTHTSCSGVWVQAQNGSDVSLTVDGGSLTATGSGTYGTGIYFSLGSGDSGSGTPSLNVSNNAIVRASGDAGGIASNASAATPSGTGIVFDGRTGTVYGSVTLQENITIGEGESLTIGDGASLNTGSHEVIVNGGTLTGGDKITGTVKYAPTITTESLPNGTVGTTYSQTLAATGSDTITWSINSGSLPDGLTLNSDTGEITGTPTTASSYSFTVKAENAYGSKTKELTITINDAKTYSVSVTPAKITLPSIKEGYDPQDPEYITIKNTGNQTIKLEDHGKNPWLIITLDKNTLKPNEEAKVSIKLKDGLSAETRSTLKGFITYTSEDGTYREHANFEVTYEIRHDMKHVEAKEATHLEEGNIEYWYCEYCDKYYDGALGTNELSLEDITIPKLTDHTATDQTSTTDSKKTNGTKTSAGLGIGLFSSLAGASAIGAGILSVLKKRNGK